MQLLAHAPTICGKFVDIYDKWWIWPFDPFTTYWLAEITIEDQRIPGFVVDGKALSFFAFNDDTWFTMDYSYDNGEWLTVMRAIQKGGQYGIL